MRGRTGRAVDHLWAHYRPRPPRTAHQLAVCAIFRDEASYLAEWVAFHRSQGAARFWLYDNLSADDWEAALAADIKSGLVTVTPWSDEPGQFSAYEHCLRTHRWDAKWVAFIDIDEFLFSPTGAPLPEILSQFTEHPAVVANWRTFGPGGHTTRPSRPVIESYLTRTADDDPINLHVKSIVQPRHTRGVANPHVFVHYGTPVGEDGRPHRGPLRDPASADLLRINHYFTRSLEEWKEKISRPRADYGDRREYVLPDSTVRDDAILRLR